MANFMTEEAMPNQKQRVKIIRETQLLKLDCGEPRPQFIDSQGYPCHCSQSDDDTLIYGASAFSQGNLKGYSIQGKDLGTRQDFDAVYQGKIGR